MGLRMNVSYADTFLQLIWLNKYILDHNFIFRSKLDRRSSQI